LRQERAWNDLHLGQVRGSYRHNGVPKPADPRSEAERRPEEHKTTGALPRQSPEDGRERTAQRVAYEEGLRARFLCEPGDRFANGLVRVLGEAGVAIPRRRRRPLEEVDPQLVVQATR
jgi:hypothetical protein